MSMASDQDLYRGMAWRADSDGIAILMTGLGEVVVGVFPLLILLLLLIPF
jgi:hypothetical protein